MKNQIEGNVTNGMETGFAYGFIGNECSGCYVTCLSTDWHRGFRALAQGLPGV